MTDLGKHAIVTIYALFANHGEAERVVMVIIKERLAACANMLPMSGSIYHWEGSIHVGAEVPCLFKTRADLAEALTRRIAELHSYEVPCVVTWPISDALPAYAAWVGENTRQN